MNEIDSDITIPDHVLNQYFRLKNQADDYLNRYIRHFRAEQITQARSNQTVPKTTE